MLRIVRYDDCLVETQKFIKDKHSMARLACLNVCNAVYVYGNDLAMPFLWVCFNVNSTENNYFFLKTSVKFYTSSSLAKSSCKIA